MFLLRVRHLLKLLASVEGKSPNVLDRIGLRLKNVFNEVLLQTRVRNRRLMPGLAHAFIFYGFLAVQVHSSEIFLEGMIPAKDSTELTFSFGAMAPGLYKYYVLVADFLAFGVLFGLAYGLYRRSVVKPKNLTNKMDAKLILLFTAVIIISFHAINAARVILHEGTAHDYGEYYVVSSLLTEMLSMSSWTAQSVFIFHEVSYFLHVTVILGFLVYIPGSKHLHTLTAVFNIFFKPLERSPAIFKTDLEDENAESFGLGKVSELSWKSVLDVYSCTECGRCTDVCPASITGKPLSPKDVIVDVKYDLFNQSESLLFNLANRNKKEGEEKVDDKEILPLVREGSGVTADVLWSCTTCRACVDICPLDIQHLDIIIEARKNLVMMESNFPDELQATFNNFENASNAWGFAPDDRDLWCADLEVKRMADHPETEILYYVGDAGCYDEKGKKVARSVVSLLNKAGVDFAILGKEERGTGDEVRRAGNEYLAQTMMTELAEIINKYKPKKIITACPHSFNILKNEYPEFGLEAEVIHHSQFLAKLVKDSKLKPDSKKQEEVAYHDSCYLGRWNDVYDAPRDILASVPNLTVKELPRNKSGGLCCGAGGGRMFMEETLGERINFERADEIIASGVKTVAVACTYCATMLVDGINDRKSEIEVKDLAVILDEATKQTM
jgi:Fe-S oxidoreductase